MAKRTMLHLFLAILAASVCLGATPPLTLSPVPSCPTLTTNSSALALFLPKAYQDNLALPTEQVRPNFPTANHNAHFKSTFQCDNTAASVFNAGLASELTE